MIGRIEGGLSGNNPPRVTSKKCSVAEISLQHPLDVLMLFLRHMKYFLLVTMHGPRHAVSKDQNLLR